MKALTVQQPHAYLIAAGEKRVENRTWTTSYRGPLAIHAGKGMQYLTTAEVWKQYEGKLLFARVLAVVQLVECFDHNKIMQGEIPQEYFWLRRDKYCEGPVCWVLAAARLLTPAVKFRGAQGLFEIDDRLLASSEE